MEMQAKADVLVEHAQFGFGVIYHTQKGREYVEKNYDLDKTVTLETTLRLLGENKDIFWDCDSKTFDTIKLLFPNALRYPNYVGASPVTYQETMSAPPTKENILIKSMEETFSSCLETAKKKNNDYGGTNKDPFYNFETSSIMSGVPVHDGLMVRMSDKWSRVKTLLKRENLVLDESIEDTIDDLINYLAILKAYIQQKNKEN